jgi:hypothetical protein
MEAYTMPLICFSVIYGAVSIFISLIYGFKAFDIHGYDPSKVNNYNPWYKINQYWFNFLGAFIGFILLYYFLILRLNLFNPCVSLFAYKAELLDIFILLLAFLGITGHLPRALLLDDLLKKLKP